MKKRISLLMASFLVVSIFGWNLLAQEHTEISVQVKKDGKLIKDTTYRFTDEAEAKHAVKMMEILSGEAKHLERYAMAHTDEGHSRTTIFISEDGEKTVISELHGDSLVWTEEGEDHQEVHVDGERVIVMKSADGEQVDVWVEEEGAHKGVKKEIKVVVSGDEDGVWSVDSKELVEIDEDANVIVIKEKEGEVDLEKILKEHEGEENVKVIVIKKDGSDEAEVKVEVQEKKNKAKEE